MAEWNRCVKVLEEQIHLLYRRHRNLKIKFAEVLLTLYMNQNLLNPVLIGCHIKRSLCYVKLSFIACKDHTAPQHNNELTEELKCCSVTMLIVICQSVATVCQKI